MAVYWPWTSRKVGSYFAGSKQVKNLVVVLLTLNKSKKLVVILRDGHGCSLDISLDIHAYLSKISS